MLIICIQCFACLLSYSILRAADLKRAQHKFKIVVNANQLQLTGCAVRVMPGGQGIVIAEGSSKSITRFSKLLLRRIDWNCMTTTLADDGKEDADAEEEEQEEDSSCDLLEKKSRCDLVWQGIFPKPHFQSFEWKDVDSQSQAILYLKSFSLEHLIKSSFVLSAASDNQTGSNFFDFLNDFE